jgi:hypothetical protein
MLARMPRPLTAAIDRAEQSSDVPDVVSSIPAKPGRPKFPANPALAHLPRP